MNLQSRTLSEPEVNLTSLIDVVFLLLIFFMVSTSFTKESELKVALPQGETTVSAAVDPAFEIVITAEGKYFVNEKELINTDPATVRDAVEKIAGKQKDIPMTIRADGKASHQSVVTVMDVLGRLGFSNINIVTVTKKK